MASTGRTLVVYYGEEVRRGGYDWPFNRNDYVGRARHPPGSARARRGAMRALYKQVIAIRARTGALAGDFQLLMQLPDAALAFMRAATFQRRPGRRAGQPRRPAGGG